MEKRWAIIANAGNHPEPMYVATAFLAHGWRCTYLTATMWARDSAMMRIAGSARLRKSGLARTVLRRSLPSDLPVESVRPLARTREYVALATRRFTPKRTGVANEARTNAFASAAGRLARRANAKPDLVVGQYNSSLELFRACPDSYRVLMYPIAHHEWMRQHLGAEAVDNPRWAPHLQGAEISDERRRHMDLEIDLADLVIVPSSFTRDTFTEVGIPAEKVVYASLGVDLELAAQIKPAPSSPTCVLRAFFAGQVNQRKGIGYLLDSIARLEKGTVSLSIAGPASEEMRALLMERYPDVVMLGTMSRSELLMHMAAADVLVLPSLAEGFGLVALEAMAVGTPAILTPRTFGADVVEHGVNGWITEAGDSNALSSLLTQISQDRESLASVSDNARETARYFGWDRYSDTVYALIADAASRGLA
jgi:glycosyltransferase involved in cell wall biosynthesis